jgi:hypothetical protein
MATLFTITKSLGYYGSGKNREELEIDETACLFGTDLWDIVKGYAGIRGVSKTAGLLKQVLTPVRVLENFPNSESFRWLSNKKSKKILPKLRRLGFEVGDWLWGENGEHFEDKFRQLQNSKVEDILADIRNEKFRQQGGRLSNGYDYLKQELLHIKLKLLGEDQDEYKLVRQNAFIQFP